MTDIPDAIFVVDPKKEKNLCTGSSYSGYSADRYLLIPTVIRKSLIM